MKRNNLQYLIDTLIRHDGWIAASELAVQLHVTDRSVRNYVSEINRDRDPILIETSHFGYRWNRNVDDIMYDSHGQAQAVPETAEERVWYLIRKLLYQNCRHLTKGISIDNITHALAISENTLVADTILLRKILSEYHVSLHIHQGIYSLSGNETDIRRLFHDRILYSFQDPYDSLETLATMFPDYDLCDLRELIRTVLSEHELNIDAYHINCLILYILIQIIRLEYRNYVRPDEIFTPDPSRSKDHQAAQSLAGSVSKRFSVSYTMWEISYLAILIVSCAYQTGSYYHTDASVVKETEFCLDKVSRTENVDLTPRETIGRFADYFDRLKIRCRYRIFARNPLSSAIRNNVPTLFDDAAYICAHFSSLWNLNVPRQEISFLTLLLSGYCGNQKKDATPITCALIVPDFYDSVSSLESELNSRFSDQMKIVGINREDDLPDAPDTDLTLSLIQLKHRRNTILISPQLTTGDYTTIQNAISNIEAARDSHDFSLFLKCYSSEELFERNCSFSTREEIIRHICERLEKSGYVDEDFQNELLIRENIDQTSYHNFVAIPHAIKRSVRKNAIYIILNDRRTQWGNRFANLIVAIAMEKELLADYQHFYRTLIRIFENKKNMSAILTCRTYREFLDMIEQING